MSCLPQNATAGTLNPATGRSRAESRRFMNSELETSARINPPLENVVDVSPMNIGISTSVVQRGKTGIAQHVFALLRALLPHADRHRFTLFVLEQDLPLFSFAGEKMTLVPVAEQWRPPVRNIFWHQFILPRLARRAQLDVLHVPSYRRMLWRRPCPLLATVHDLAPFHVAAKYDWKRMFYGRVVARQLAHRQDALIDISRFTAIDIARLFGVPKERFSVVRFGL
jgi:hypothetical protein